jgi:hypothetical protein
VTRKALIVLLVLYFLAALTFGLVSAITKPLAVVNWKDPVFVGDVIGTGIHVYVVPAIIPLIVWAFGRFRCESATIPLVIWAVLGLADMGFVLFGRHYEQQRELARLADSPALSGADREDFVQGARNSCIASQRQSIPAGAAAAFQQQVEKLCSCYADAMVNALTGNEIRALAANGTIPANAQQKAEQAATSCRRLAFGQ